MSNCNNRVKQTCGSINYATCISYETELPTFSELGGCVSIEETTEELYNLVGEIKEEIDLSELGEKCLEYITDENNKVVVKNVLLKFEEKICELEEKVTELETTDICNKSITSCNLDLSCLDSLPCDTPINTLGDLLQAMINKICETP
jgi:hypothetical protein